LYFDYYNIAKDVGLYGREVLVAVFTSQLHVLVLPLDLILSTCSQYKSIASAFKQPLCKEFFGPSSWN